MNTVANIRLEIRVRGIIVNFYTTYAGPLEENWAVKFNAKF